MNFTMYVLFMSFQYGNLQSLGVPANPYSSIGSVVVVVQIAPIGKASLVAVQKFVCLYMHFQEGHQLYLVAFNCLLYLILFDCGI